jgi:hypothetical protein
MHFANMQILDAFINSDAAEQWGEWSDIALQKRSGK